MAKADHDAQIARLKSQISTLEGKLSFTDQERIRVILENNDLRTSNTTQLARIKHLEYEVAELKRQLVDNNIILPDLRLPPEML